VQKHSATLARFEDAPAEEHESMVAGCRDDLGAPFFEYLQLRVTAAHEDESRQKELVALGTRLAALYDAFEAAEANQQALQAAVGNFQELLQVCCIADATQKLG
jgi:hypothetical protein